MGRLESRQEGPHCDQEAMGKVLDRLGLLLVIDVGGEVARVAELEPEIRIIKQTRQPSTAEQVATGGCGFLLETLIELQPAPHRFPGKLVGDLELLHDSRQSGLQQRIVGLRMRVVNYLHRSSNLRD